MVTHMPLQPTTISDLPLGCISHILSLTTPKDVCRLSAVCSSFQSAADSDYVWERMFPPDLPALLSRAVSPITFTSKKDLFFRLCTSPLIMDSGKRSFSLVKGSGKKCFMISAKELVIMRIEEENSWRWVSNYPDSRFPEVAELLLVSQLEIRGAIERSDLSPNTWYAAYIILKHAEHSMGFDYPVNLALFVRDHDGTRMSIREALIHRPGDCWPEPRLLRWLPRHPTESPDSPLTPPTDLRPREDGWMEVEIGEFFVNGDDNGGRVQFSLLEVIGGHMKRGLVLQGIEIRPKTQLPPILTMANAGAMGLFY